MMLDKTSNEAVAWFVRLRSSDVSSADRHAFQEWFDADESCREAFEAVASEWYGLDSLDDWARGELSQLNLNATFVRRRRELRGS